MNTVELLQFSLGNALGVLEQVVSDLTQEQADWQPPGTAVAIGALYWHLISSTDAIVHQWCIGHATLDETEGWKDRAVLASPPPEEGEHAASMKAVRVDLPAVRQYAQAVGAAVQGWLASLVPEDLERKLDTPIGEQSLAELVVTFVIWHINAHCGEISALKGCQGATGYPF
jgi:hypothetical protein